MLKTITNPNTVQVFKFGRKRPVAPCPHFRLSNYMKASIPTPPTTCDYTKSATQALSQIYMNQSLGDCTVAGMAHIDDSLLGTSGSVPPIFTDSQIVRVYSAVSGYIPGNESTDSGADEQTCLNYWWNNGLLADGSHKISGWMKVDGNNVNECKTAVWLFGNLYFGVELPDAWINPFPSSNGFVWTTAGDPDPENGHCFVSLGYGQGGFTIDTWGMLGTITSAAIAKYATTTGSGELYTVISKDGLNKATQLCPAGMDWSQLAADLDSMAGSVVVKSK